MIKIKKMKGNIASEPAISNSSNVAYLDTEGSKATGFKAIRSIVSQAMEQQDEMLRNQGLTEACVKIQTLRERYFELDEQDCDGGQRLLLHAARGIADLQRKPWNAKLYNNVMWDIKAAANNLEGIAI